MPSARLGGMAANPGIQEPGKKYGPCKTVCTHRDCGQSRETATSLCRFCCKVIGYDTRFYNDPKAGGADAHHWVHADCLEDAIEKGAA